MDSPSGEGLGTAVLVNRHDADQTVCSADAGCAILRTGAALHGKPGRYSGAPLTPCANCGLGDDCSMIRDAP